MKYFKCSIGMLSGVLISILVFYIYASYEFSRLVVDSTISLEAFIEQGKAMEVTSTPKEASIQVHVVKCACGDSSQLVVKTVYRLVPDSICHQGMAIESQDIRFSSGANSKSVILPFRKKDLAINGKTVSVMETVLTDVKCHLNGTKGVYSLYGIHWFDSPHEFFALCSQDGEWLNYYYGSIREVYDQYDNGHKYELEYGSDVNSLKNMVSVLPLPPDSDPNEK